MGQTEWTSLLTVGVFSNFASGLWLLFKALVRPGDVLMVHGDTCEVRSLGLRAAVLWRSLLTVAAAYLHSPEQVIPLLEAPARGVDGLRGIGDQLQPALLDHRPDAQHQPARRGRPGDLGQLRPARHRDSLPAAVAAPSSHGARL